MEQENTPLCSESFASVKAVLATVTLYYLVEVERMVPPFMIRDTAKTPLQLILRSLFDSQLLDEVVTESVYIFIQ